MYITRLQARMRNRMNITSLTTWKKYTPSLHNFPWYAVFHIDTILTDYRYIFSVHALCILFLRNLKNEPGSLTSIWEASRFPLDLVHLFYSGIPSAARLWQSVSQPLDINPRDHPPSCSSCLNAIYLGITEAPLTAETLTFNLENCLALVVCFHYCQLFRSLCRRTDSLYHNPWVAGLQWRFYAFSFSATCAVQNFS